MLRRIGDVLDLIARMQESSNAELQQHAATLVGPRTRGSTTTHGLDALPRDRRLEDVTLRLTDKVRIPGCRYYRCEAGELNPCLGAIAYNVALELFPPDKIKQRDGAHGPELYLDLDALLENLRVTDICIILGPPGEYEDFDDGVIYTWHPGSPLACFKAGEEPHELTGVKLHAG